MKLSPFTMARILVILLISGCGMRANGPYERHAINGTITLDGELLAEGQITFHPETGPVVSSASIEDGNFEIPVAQGLTVGKYKVSITATKPLDPNSVDPEELIVSPPDAIELIPIRYNTETILTFEVENVPVNEFSYDLMTE